MFTNLIQITEENEDTFENIIENELSSYLKEKCLQIHLSPNDWWKDNKSRFPHIFNVALDYLGIIATQVSSEREFSTAGNIVTATRSKLLNENIEMLSFLHSNLTI